MSCLPRVASSVFILFSLKALLLQYKIYCFFISQKELRWNVLMYKILCESKSEAYYSDKKHFLITKKIMTFIAFSKYDYMGFLIDVLPRYWQKNEIMGRWGRI